MPTRMPTPTLARTSKTAIVVVFLGLHALAASAVALDTGPGPQRIEQETGPEPGQIGEKSQHPKSFWQRTTDDPVALFTMGILVFNGLLTYATYRLVVSTNRLWEAGERQLKFARTSVEAAIGLETPKVVLASIDLEGSGCMDVLLEQPCVRVDVKNHGRTPAFLTKSRVEIRVGMLPQKPVYGEPVRLAASQVVERDVPYRLDDSGIAWTRFSPADRKAAADGAKPVWIYGYVAYRDYLGENHVARFCQRYYPATDRARGGWRDGDAPEAYTKGY